jgi:hypothetical protein
MKETAQHSKITWNARVPLLSLHWLGLMSAKGSFLVA